MNTVSATTVHIVAVGTPCTIRALQAGDSNYNAAPNLDQSFTVNPASTSTTITSAPTVIYNANGIVTVTVGSGAGTPGGNVSLSVDGGAAINQALVSGSTTFTLTSPSPGVHTLSASYAAQGNFAASGPASGTLTVDLAPSITSDASTTFAARGPGWYSKRSARWS